jgi:hypothetical protein
MAAPDHTRNKATAKEAFLRALRWLVVVVLSPFLAALVIMAMLAYGAYALLLHVLLWVLWNPAGKRVLLVYSNSPTWQSYIEEHIIPRLPPGAIVLNWSERRQWRRWSLAYLVFRFFGGRYEFNPLAVVIHPFRWGRTFRFWQAFRDFKHGRRDTLAWLEAQFFHASGVGQHNGAM